MKFENKTVSAATWIGVGLSMVAALVAAAFIYMDEAREAAAAQQMLRNGVVAKATPTYASSSTTKRRRGGSSTTYSIRYAFWDAQMRRFDGEDTATQGEFSALADPNNPSTMRRNASVDVVYDRANPAKNGLKSRFESQSSIDWLNVGLVLAIVLGVCLLITWGVRSFMKKRVATMPVVAPAAAWQPPAA